MYIYIYTYIYIYICIHIIIHIQYTQYIRFACCFFEPEDGAPTRCPMRAISYEESGGTSQSD